MSAEVIDGTADEVGREVVVAAPAPALAVTPTVKAGELVERLSVIRDAMNTAMQRDVDYGVVPGTDKPTLFKPGAEKLSVLFQLDVQLDNAKTWGPGDHLTVESKATVYHAPTGSRLGFGEGLCSTREKKYGKRRQERTCPSCGVAAVIKGKEEYGGGWLCWKKRDGCNAKFPDGDQSIEGQRVGEIENPDLPDLWNTVVKMAEKRARVDAVLAVTGASALFTQDAEDMAQDPAPEQVAHNGSKRLTGDQVNRVLAAVADCGVTVEEWEQYRGALGARSDAELTTEQAKVVRKWLDGHARSSDIPADVPFVESEADLAPQEPLDLTGAEAV